MQDEKHMYNPGKRKVTSLFEWVNTQGVTRENA